MPSTSGKKYSIKPEHISILKKLQEIEHPIEAWELCEKTGLEYEKLMSGAVYSLSELKLVQFAEQEVNLLTLTEEGQTYLKNGLPERQLFNLFNEGGRKEVSVIEFQKEAETAVGMDKKIFFIGLGQMKKKKWVAASKATGQERIFIYTENPPLTPEEEVIKLFAGKKYLKEEEVPKQLGETEQDLFKRKIINHEKKTLRTISLTEAGKSIKDNQITKQIKELLHLTADMIKTNEWKDKLDQLKDYDVSALGPRIEVGKYHPITIIINQIREIFHSMGFSEIKGPIVESAFFNFDALYQPQDHPAREMHDTFYLKNPAQGRLPAKEYTDAVRQTHENGGESKSLGWRYQWSEDIAKKMVLRTHTTATTVRQLGSVIKENKKLPMKVFCIDRVFRNEKVDRTHLAEFQQIEGIVIGENVTLCDLIGQIVEFYKRMGFSKVITRPGFFPYTEPSMEIAVYSEKLGRWLEMGGSGIFRPEVTYPWGIREPVRVLAWGMGLERLAMLKLQRSDIRDLYQSPISWLREVPY
jgi:phenylalanyl-tRNA synthetase alpha chain